MIVAVAVLVASGYFAVRGFLREKEFLPALALGTPMAWGAFITVVNLWLRAGTAFAVAVPITGAIILSLGAAGAVLLRRSQAGRASLDRRDLASLAVGAFPASAIILLGQLLGPDSDNFIHYPLIALFMKGYFPHVHPYFPDVALHGHYGRDLGLAGLLSFGEIAFGTAMLIEAWVLHLATLGNVYFLARRAGGGRVGGALAAYFAFFAVNAGFGDWVVRSGLAEVMGNNNPVVYGFMFAILHLVALAIQRPTWMIAVPLGLLVGGFDMVYETHFHVTVLALGVLASALWLPAVSRTLGRRPAATITVGLALGLVVMTLSGGLTSRLLLARVTPRPATATSGAAYDWARAGAEQAVQVSFPKRPFLSLTHARDGQPVALLSRAFLGSQGIAFWLLPLSTVVLAIARQPVGLACAVVAWSSILIPAAFDFGRFNGENFRYIFLSGLMAAVCLGMAVGEFFGRLTNRRGARHRLYARAVVGICLALLLTDSRRSYALYRYMAMIATDFPYQYRITETQRLRQYCITCEAADVEAMRYLAEHGKGGERLATNYAVPSLELTSGLINPAMVIITGSRLPMVGFNMRIMRDGGGIRSSVHGWSARAVAFWATGDEEILRDLDAHWLYVVPRWLSPAVAGRLAESAVLREAFRSADGDVRIVYRVERERMPPRPAPARPALERLSVRLAATVDRAAPETFVRVPLRVRNDGPDPVSLSAYVVLRVFDRTAAAYYDRRDAVGTVHALRMAPGEEAMLTVPFVVPYNDGDYDIAVLATSGGDEVRLGSFSFTVSK